MPNSKLVRSSGSRAWLNPPSPVGVFDSSTVVGVSKAVETLANRLRLRAALTVTPTEGLTASMVRSPDWSPLSSSRSPAVNL